MNQPPVIWVQAPARLHLGMIDLRGDLGRRFGGIGVAIEQPSLLLEVRPAEQLAAEGAQAQRILGYARRFLSYHSLRGAARFCVHRAIPAHAGLGSGTQAALATARALAALHDLPAAAPGLAAAVGRARRSAIGTWAFAQGGFLLDGGRRPGDADPAPLLVRRALPEPWRCVLAIPPVARGLSGDAEHEAFRVLPRPPAAHVGEIARLIVMLLLPALLEQDLDRFGRAVTDINRLAGETFRTVQGGAYAHPDVAELVDDLLEWGAAGAGQSSWGPAVYALVGNEADARALARRLATKLGDAAPILTTSFDNIGARCWRE